MHHDPAASRRGANAIEFALTLPAFILAFTGTLHLGMFFFAWMLADEGARRACNEISLLDEGQANLPIRAKTEMNKFFSTGGFTCDTLGCTAAVSGVSPGRVLTCRATADLSDIYGLSVLPLALDVHHERVLAFQ